VGSEGEVVCAICLQVHATPEALLAATPPGFLLEHSKLAAGWRRPASEARFEAEMISSWREAAIPDMLITNQQTLQYVGSSFWFRSDMIVLFPLRSNRCKALGWIGEGKIQEQAKGNAPNQQAFNQVLDYLDCLSSSINGSGATSASLDRFCRQNGVHLAEVEFVETSVLFIGRDKASGQFCPARDSEFGAHWEKNLAPNMARPHRGEWVLNPTELLASAGSFPARTVFNNVVPTSASLVDRMRMLAQLASER
jgi:hypothetical protein